MLPIGSVVYLNEGRTKIMILNRGPIFSAETPDEARIMYDYSGCLYPQGLDPNNVFYFNEENIDKVLYEGYKDEEEDRFQEVYHHWVEENKTSIKKGTVPGPLR
ncbi:MULTISPECIES: DUF4176 domain-containing protein [Allobacillus]|uniref:DUF4176 domain-containing protein n=1 Tax=Allobacillus salarius TaxID=1955272 RepID=A0A556PKQ5_9BACI|nr:DUF4176 domain-containing protein [Allobacillus salarius]TSJ64970.1 DUF4176 domain-containing protein [Allobacillus salarius]